MIGLFGGTFDPVHYGHLRSALEMKDSFGLDEVRMIPCAKPSHREQPKATATMRLQMLELAIKNQAGLKIDTRELDRYAQHQAPSYMVDTLKSLRQDFKDAPLLLFIGSDAFKQLTRWHQWQQLFDYAHLVVLTRPGFEAPGFETQELDDFFNARQAKDIKELAQNRAGKLFLSQVTQLDISATAIRNMIAKKQNPGFLLPDAVIEYIKQHQLYETY